MGKYVRANDIVLFDTLSPKQRLSYVLTQVNGLQKQSQALLELATALAPEYKQATDDTNTAMLDLLRRCIALIKIELNPNGYPGGYTGDDWDNSAREILSAYDNLE